MKEWENLANTENLEVMTTRLNMHVTEALDECAPMKTFKVRELHKFGISESTKQLIKDRDIARKSIKTKTGMEKVVQHTKYKKLRNRVNSELKKQVEGYEQSLAFGFKNGRIPQPWPRPITVTLCSKS